MAQVVSTSTGPMRIPGHPGRSPWNRLQSDITNRGACGCHSHGSTTCPSPSTASPPASRSPPMHPSGMRASVSMSGCSLPGSGTRAGPPASTTPSLSATVTASAPRSWAPTSSAHPAGGTTRTGRAGGARTRRSTHRPSCSLTAPGPRSRWRAAPRSTSSTSPRPRRSRRRAQQPMARTSGSAAARPSYATSSPPGSSTTCISCRSRSCSAAVSASGTVWRPSRMRYDIEAVSSPSGVTHLTFTRAR